jgi:allophanate hydrolase subunit 2
VTALAIERVAGLCAIQDGGRRGHMHEGVPRGGALVPELLARANRLACNAWGAPAIEIFGSMRVVADGALVAATENGAIDLAPGVAATIERARYLAVAGGFDVLRVLDGRGALPVAGIGHVVRAGDVLSAGTDTLPPEELPLLDDRDRPIRVLLGPDRARFHPSAIADLFGDEYRVSPKTDRTGMRLDGVALARADADDAASAPMIRGAIQVPASGEPIVLGPDHPTTGGYPVIAVVIRADHGALAARAPRSRVRFVPVSIDEARDAWRSHRARFFAP